eukprot:CAMPEP_0177655330 /NCGR_PEP_ID=MMETSP0447-20121125/14897_1 /TAXON_ID=0 /ORGANISM="Stygamoeba regulata, Strain BSH-02190019" /LENGTH=205 /DNA_ID=CAMNT_0019159217 /DNA_START=113 /DNA_END=727 /DNA_ORIENTATION=-
MQNPNEDTVWNDVLRQVGILPGIPVEEKAVDTNARPLNPSLDKIIDSAWDDLFGQMTAEEMAEHEDDDLEDNRKYNKLRKRKEAEEREEANFSWGRVQPITREQYKHEVNQAPPEMHVVVHLVKDGHPASVYMNKKLEVLAAKNPKTKFVEIDYQDCIPGYPLRNLPTLFVYKKDELLLQVVGVMKLGGKLYSLEGVCVCVCVCV